MLGRFWRSHGQRRDEQHPSRCQGTQVRGTDCDKHVGHQLHEQRVPQVSVGGNGLGLGSAEPSGQWGSG